MTSYPQPWWFRESAPNKRFTGPYYSGLDFHSRYVDGMKKLGGLQAQERAVAPEQHRTTGALDRAGVN